MGNTPINPTEPPPPPNTPPITVQVDDVQYPPAPDPNTPAPIQTFNQSVSLIWWTARDLGCPVWLCWSIAVFISAFILVGALLWSTVSWAFVNLGVPVGAAVIKGISDTRKNIDPAMPSLAADVLSELTGAEIKTEQLPTGQGFKDHLARVTAIGASLHDLLEKEFAPTGTIDTTQGPQAARAFSGFNVNFGIGTAFIGLLGEIESLGILEQFRELGVEVSRNLGLGRLHRQALQPLIHTLIATPYTWHLNEKYRPARLPHGKLIEAFFRRAVTEQQMRTELAQEGWADERMNDLIQDARPFLDPREVAHLYFRGLISADAFKTLVMNKGWQEYEVEFILDLERPRLDKAETLELYEFGQIDRASTLAGLQKLGYTSDDAELIVLGFEMKIDATRRPKNIRHKARTFQQLRKEFLDGVIDLTEWNDALTQVGYDADAISAMTQDLLIDQAGRKTTRTTHAVPSLSWAQLKAAFKAGVLDRQEVTDHLSHRGYSAADIATLLKELPAPPPPPPTPAA